MILRPSLSPRLPGLVMAAALVFAAGCASDLPAPTLLSLPSAATAGAPAAAPMPASPPSSTTPAPASAAAPTTAPTGATVPHDPTAPVLVVRRVGVPEYLSARRVRFRSDASTLAEWPNTFWAERIEIGLSREFTAALRRGLPGWVVCEGSCPDRQPRLSVQLDFGTLDYLRPARTLQSQARVVVGAVGGQAQVVGAFDRTETLPVPQDSAQGQAQAYADLLRRLAEASVPVIMRARQ